MTNSPRFKLLRRIQPCVWVDLGFADLSGNLKISRNHVKSHSKVIPIVREKYKEEFLRRKLGLRVPQ